MSCKCNCSCGSSASCGCYETVCPSCAPSCITTTTTTTTINPNCQPCEETYDCQCVVYNGSYNPCGNLSNGDTLCTILENIVKNLPTCNTTQPPLNCVFTAVVTEL